MNLSTEEASPDHCTHQVYNYYHVRAEDRKSMAIAVQGAVAGLKLVTLSYG